MEYQEREEWMEKGPNVDIGKIYADWKVGGKPIVEAVMENYPEPEPGLTERQRRGAMLAASLADATASLAEMFAAGRGVHVRNREGATAMKKTSERLRELEEKYEKDLLRWRTAKGNAGMQDFNLYLKAAMDRKGYERQYALYRRKKADEEAMHERERKEKKEDAAEEHRRELELLRERGAQRRTWYGAKEAAKNVPLRYVVRANRKRGGEGLVREGGEELRVYDLTPERARMYLSMALKDPELAGRRELYRKRKTYMTDDITGMPMETGSETVVDEEKMLQAFIEKMEAGGYDGKREVLPAWNWEDSEFNYLNRGGLPRRDVQPQPRPQPRPQPPAEERKYDTGGLY